MSFVDMNMPTDLYRHFDSDELFKSWGILVCEENLHKGQFAP